MKVQEKGKTVKMLSVTADDHRKVFAVEAQGRIWKHWCAELFTPPSPRGSLGEVLVTGTFASPVG